MLCVISTAKGWNDRLGYDVLRNHLILKSDIVYTVHMQRLHVSTIFFGKLDTFSFFFKLQFELDFFTNTCSQHLNGWYLHFSECYFQPLRSNAISITFITSYFKMFGLVSAPLMNEMNFFHNKIDRINNYNTFVV